MLKIRPVKTTKYNVHTIRESQNSLAASSSGASSVANSATSETNKTILGIVNNLISKQDSLEKKSCQSGK